ncbi:peptidyl-prolyl cis-trans isomerase [Puniceicoccus vermicola]|uniref:Peptidyl-prolyl cis-trans isomerase n=1 Tax=Puniceicoccus vermicola TaxID=388746 RepID=A0A7X1E5G7_9BACT|nr:peptidyl-prolyl cis-trans isomerase [Puniceicoccus vermicola]MBC2603018.1 peptidyl-prolyl cis-trans isomerase [Puniceicoccus vermicola]
MISWIQNALEKKGRVIFIILLAVVIVSFVFVIGETPGCVSKEPGAQTQKFYGYSLNAEADSRSNDMVREVIISSIVNRGQQPQNEQMLTQEFLSRIALLHLADEAKIPEPNQAAFINYLSTVPFFQDSNGNFDPNRVTSFLDMTQLSRQFDEATINRALSNDYRIQQLMLSISPPGFTLPFEIEEQARRGAATYDLSVAVLKESDLDFSVDPTEEELQDFYTQRVEAYRTPESRSLSIIRFSPEAFTSEVADPTDAELQQYFSQNRTNYLNEDAKDPADALPQLDAVRDQVVADWKEQQATTLARQASEDFVYALFDQEISEGTPEFENMLSSYSVELETLPPMVGNVPPADSDLPQSAFGEAARLDEIRYFSDPIETENEIVVVILTDVTPSLIPDFQSVREEVLANFTEQSKQENLVSQGEEIRTQLSDMIAEGQSFEKAASSLNLTVENFESVGWENMTEGLPNSAIRRAETLPENEVSSMVVTEEGGNFLFVQSRGAPQFGPDSEEYQRTQNILGQSTARLFMSSFVGDLIQAGSTGAQSGGQ